MKKKCISTATLSVLLLVLFLPVFYYIVFYGTNVNYNEMHKIITVEGNKVLFPVRGDRSGCTGGSVLFSAKDSLHRTHSSLVYRDHTGSLYSVLSCEYKNIQMHCILRWLGLRHGGQFRPLAL